MRCRQCGCDRWMPPKRADIDGVWRLLVRCMQCHMWSSLPLGAQVERNRILIPIGAGR